MMTPEVSPRDWQMISEYADGQLDPQQRIRLEARLRQEPALRTALEQLQRTRTVLHSASRRRRPRNFTLTPAMIGYENPRTFSLRLQSIFTLRLTSVLATLLLVVTFIGNFLLVRLPSPMAQSAPADVAQAPAAVQVMEMPAAENTNQIPAEQPSAKTMPSEEAAYPAQDAGATQPSALAAEAQPTATPDEIAVTLITGTPEPTPGVLEMEPGNPQATTELPLVSISPEAPLGEPPRMVGTLEAEMPGTATPEDLAVVALPSPTASPTPSPTPEAVQAEEFAQETAAAVSQAPVTPPDENQRLSPPFPDAGSTVPGGSWLGLRIFQVALGLIAIAAAIGAAYLSRRQS